MYSDNPDNITKIETPEEKDYQQQQAIPPEVEVPARPRLRGYDRFTDGFMELGRMVLMILAVYTLMNLAIPRYVVEGHSMQPVFEGEGDERVMVSRLDYILGEPQRGDIVVLKSPNGSDEHLIKRIIGLPGETVQMENGQVFINGTPIEEPYVMELCNRATCNGRTWVLNDHQYIVLGDNRNASHDSVSFGPVERSLIVGRAWIRYWPLKGLDVFRHHDYGELDFDNPPAIVPETTPQPELPPAEPANPVDTITG